MSFIMISMFIHWVLVLIGEDAFERRRYMNVVVQRARHPQLRDYIHSAVSGLLPFIQKVAYWSFSLILSCMSMCLNVWKENFLLVSFLNAVLIIGKNLFWYFVEIRYVDVLEVYTESFCWLILFCNYFLMLVEWFC